MKAASLTFSTFVLLAMAGLVCVGSFVRADDTEAEKQKAAESSKAPAKEKAAEEKAADKKAEAEATTKSSTLRPLTKDKNLWIDTKRKLVVIDGKVCLREGQLEMFACPKGTKEHESVITVDCQAKFVHAALLAIGAKAGSPVEFDPKYKPATGTVIDIWILWIDKKGGKHRVRAQDWVRYAKTGKVMPYDFVFAGSGFWKDDQTGERFYHADSGDFICVSNFPTAMLDLPVKSSQGNVDLLFEAFTEKIPEVGTKVRLVLVPRQEKKDDKKSTEEKKAEAKATTKTE